MATRFATQFALAAAPGLVRQFGDAAVYLPRLGAARAISYAILERELTEDVNGMVVQSYVVRVLDSETEGILATEINEGGDQFEMPWRVGEAASTRTIVRVLSTENGLVRFAAR